MPRKNNEPIGYLKYKLKLKDGGVGLPVTIPVDSLEQADKIRELRISKNNETIEHIDFKVVGLHNKKVLWDYSKTADQQRRPLIVSRQQQPARSKKPKL